MATGWDRLESMVRTVELTGGLEARVADPLWMLARQWQVGEFRGDDAAQPAAIRFRGRSAPLATFRAGPDPAAGAGGGTGGSAGAQPVPFPAGRPLEAVAEATPEPGFGSAQLHASARAGRRLARLLREAGLGAAERALRARFPLAAPTVGVEVGSAGRAAVKLLARWGIDATSLARTPTETVLGAVRPVVAAADLPRMRGILAAWLRWYAARGGFVQEQTWDGERLEYAFSLGVRAPAGEVVLSAPEHAGDHLDWYSFDVATDPAASHGLGAGPVPVRTKAAVPTPVRYAGMPAQRWWEFEDRSVDFGAIEAGPADLARLLVAEFATSYGRDWFVVPVTVPVGSLTELSGVEVIDTFGGRTPVPSTARADLDRTGGADRAWRLFELTGDQIGERHPSPWLFVPPSLASTLEGPALERVGLTRDEAANLAWGIERLVEGPLGRSVDRAEAWYAAAPPLAPAAASPPPAAGAPAPAAGNDAWQYRLEASAPPWWIPFVAERIDPADAAQVRLRRARMQSWALLGEHRQLGPQSALLDPRQPCWLYEEEVPTSGVRLERSWQAGRWHDGTLHVWLQRRKRPGRGERSSGIRWDLLRSTGAESRDTPYP